MLIHNKTSFLNKINVIKKELSDSIRYDSSMMACFFEKIFIHKDRFSSNFFSKIQFKNNNVEGPTNIPQLYKGFMISQTSGCTL